MLQSNWFVDEDKACTALQYLQGKDKELLRFPFLCGGRTDLQAAGGQEQLNHSCLHLHLLVTATNINFFIPKLLLLYYGDNFYLHAKTSVSMIFTWPVNVWKLRFLVDCRLLVKNPIANIGLLFFFFGALMIFCFVWVFGSLKSIFSFFFFLPYCLFWY